MPDLLNILNAHLDPIVKWALLLAAVGTAVMALLEAAKAIARLRYVYHWAFVRQWLGPPAYAELKSLTLGRTKRPGPLLDQPTDKLMAQVQASANLSLDFPVTFPSLYDFFTRVTNNPGRDAATWRDFSARVESGAIADPSTDPGAAAATRARARLDHLVARKLDTFQTKTEFWWARSNQLVAVAGSAIVLFFVLDRPFLTAIVGGMVAPVAKDLAAALSGLRGK